MIESINHIADKWFAFQLAIGWQVAILIAIVWCVDLLIKKWAWPQVRYALWLLILVKLVLPPTLTSPASLTSNIPLLAEKTVKIDFTRQQAVPKPTESVIPPDTFIPMPAEIETETTETSIAPLPQTEQLTSPPPVTLSLKFYAMAVWLLGIIVLSTWLIVRLKNLRKENLSSPTNKLLPERFQQLLKDTAGKLKLKTIPKVILTDKVCCPAVFGIFKPVLLFPADKLGSMSQQDTEYILLHELAHIKRGDLFIHAVYMILQIAYWFNPLIWLIRRQLQNLRELCCDATVAKILKEKTCQYRQTLLETAKQLLVEPVDPGMGLLGLFENSNRLLDRLKWLEKKTWKNRPLRIVVIFILVCLMATCVIPMARPKDSRQEIIEKTEVTAMLTNGVEDEADISEKTDRSEIRTIAVSGVVTDKIGRVRNYVYISPSGTNLWGKIRTNVKGRFVLENIQPEQKVWLAYSQHSKAIGVFTIPENYKGQTIHVVLNYQEAEISGRVVDGNGAGLADRQVELVFKTKQGLTFIIPAYQKTDKYGVYFTSPVPCGSGLRVQARVVNTDENEQEYITEPVALVDNQANIEMPLLITGRGQYTDSDDGWVLYSGRVLNEQSKPVPGAKVELSYNWRNSMSSWSKKTITDTQGRWNIRLPADHSNLSVRLLHPDYISFHYDQSSRKPSKAELLDGSNIMVMKKGSRIKGTVRDPHGKGIKNALIAAGRLYSSSDGKIIEDCTTDRTRADGTFSIGGLPRQQVDLGISVPGYAPVIASVEVSKDTKPVEVTLKKGRTYRGQIVDKDGNPLEEIKVCCNKWNVEGERRHLSVLTKTDSQGLFAVADVPDTGTLTFGFGKSRSPLQFFSKQMPEDISKIDRMIMYPVPVIAAKVIDAKTKEPVTNFTVTQGCKRKSTNDEPNWSRHYKKEISSEDGSFEKQWNGFSISYPFDGAVVMKIEAEGYYSQSTPLVELGKQYEPFVIELTRAEQLTGTIVDSDGNTAGGAEVGWVGPGRKAFITDGKFDRRGFSYQAETIVNADKKGRFSLNPERGDALIVVMHDKGYAQVGSADFQNNSEIKLIPWARIETTIDMLESEKSSEISIITLTKTNNTDMTPRIYWMFDQFTITKGRFTIEHIPAEPLHIAKNLRFEQHNARFIEPKPGETYKIHLGDKGSTVTGKINLADSSSHDYANPRQSHVAAFKVNGKPNLPEKLKNLHRSSFSWFQDKAGVYPASRTYQNRFIPNIDPKGNFTFNNIPAGEYELVINLHDQLGKNVSCGRGVLRAACVIPFTVENQRAVTQIPQIDLKPFVYPTAGQKAPPFEAKTFDGKSVSLREYREKFVLLEFWATWCGPCVQQMPKIKKLYETFEDNKNFVMFGMNLDWDIEKTKKYIAVEKLNWPQLSLGSMDESDIVKKYGIGGVPAIILIGPNGNILSKNPDIKNLESIIKKGLKKDKTKPDVQIETKKPALQVEGKKSKKGNLQAAIADGDIDEIKKLIEEGADVNARTKDGSTLLHSVAGNGNKAIVELLLENGADVNAKHNKDHTPLHFAVRTGKKEVVKLLLTNGARVNTKDEWGYTPLHWAARKGHLEVLELLLANGANINTKNNDGLSPLEHAAKEKQQKIVEVLVRNGAHLGSEPKNYGIVEFKQNDNAYTQQNIWKYEWGIELDPDVSENNTFQILKTTKVISGQAELHPDVAVQEIINKSVVEKKYKSGPLKFSLYVGDEEPRYNYHKYDQKLSGWLCGFYMNQMSRSKTMLFPGKEVINFKPNKQGNFVGSDLELLSFETSEENIKYEHKVILRKSDSPKAKSAALLRLKQMTQRQISNKKLQYLDRILTTYAKEHNSTYPDKLEQIKPYDTDEWLDWLFENIEYLGKGKILAETPDTVLAYDKTLLRKTDSTNVLFDDGPVQYCNPDWLKKLGITGAKKPAGQVERKTEGQKTHQTKTVYLPDVDNEAVMLDLVSGQLVGIPEPVTGMEVLAKIDKLDKGDVIFDTGVLIFVRGASSNSSIPHPGGIPVKTYKIPTGELLPEKIIVTNRSGEHYELEILSVDKEGCQLEYYELPITQKPTGQVEGPDRAGEQESKRAGEGENTKFEVVDFEGYFADSADGGRALEQLWDDKNKDLRDADEILETVRKGLRRYSGSGNILRWIGNLFIWGENPQNEKAIELMYHASGSPNRRLYGDAIYFGLSVTKNKTPEILRAMTAVAMKTDDYYNVTGRILWGCRRQKDELIACLEPYLNSDDKTTRQKARDVKDYFTDKKAFMAKRAEQHKESVKQEYGDKVGQLKDDLLKGNSQTRLDTLKLLRSKDIMSIVDASFIDAFRACTKDADPKVRRSAARMMGGKFVWNGKPQNQQAIDILVELLDDPDHSTRYAAVYYGLSTVRNPDKELVGKILATILDDREINYYGRVIWGLRRNKQACVDILVEWMDQSKQDKQRAVKAYEIYEDVLAEQLPAKYAKHFTGQKSNVHEGVAAMCISASSVSKQQLQKQFLEHLANSNLTQKVLNFYIIETRETAVGMFTCDNLSDRNAIRSALAKDRSFRIAGYMHGSIGPTGSGWIDSLEKFRKRNKSNRISLSQTEDTK